MHKTQPRYLSRKTKERIVFVISLIGIFLFLYTAYSKLSSMETFEKGLSRLPIFGSYASIISWLIPISEIIIAVLLITPKTTKVGLYAFTALMVFFTAYILSLMIFGLKLPCHCGGVIDSLSWTQHIWFNLVFIVLGITAIFFNHNYKYS